MAAGPFDIRVSIIVIANCSHYASPARQTLLPVRISLILVGHRALRVQCLGPEPGLLLAYIAKR
jgi:hypothetical protein